AARAGSCGAPIAPGVSGGKSTARSIMSSLIQFLAPSIPQSSPAGRVWRWPPPVGRRGERPVRAIVSLAAALAALVLFATATHGQVTTPAGAMPVGWYAT